MKIPLRLAVAASLGALLGGLGGCSLQDLDFNPCETSAECQDIFGVGATCGDTGFCEVVPLASRCETALSDAPAFPAPRDETLILGALFDHSSTTHLARAKSVALAVASINNNGGLDGIEVALLQCTSEASSTLDELTEDDATELVAAFLAQDLGLAAIIGPSSSARVELAYAQAEPAGTLILSPSATSPALTDLDGLTSTDESPGLLWRTAAPDSLQGDVIASDMIGRSVASASIVYQEGAYGDGLADAFQRAFQGSGGALNRYPFADSGGRDNAVAEAGANSDEEVLFISSSAVDIQAFLNAAAILGGYDTKGVFLTDAAANAELFGAESPARDVFPRVRGTRPVSPAGIVFDAFAASYAGAYGEDPSRYAYTAHSFDAAWLAVYGAAWSWFQNGSITGLGIGQGLRRVSAGQEIELRPTTWNTAQASFEAGVAVDVVGASGSLNYDPVTGETSTTIGVWIIVEGGTIENVYTVDPGE